MGITHTDLFIKVLDKFGLRHIFANTRHFVAASHREYGNMCLCLSLYVHSCLEMVFLCVCGCV